MQRGLKVLAIVALVFALVGVSGCQAIAEKAAEGAVEKATGVKVDAQGDSVTIKTDEGEATISEEAELPADFPADVPMYENATIETVMTNDVEGGKSYLVGAKSDDDAGEINKWYKKALEDKGWTIKSVMEVGDSVGGVSAEKGDLNFNLAVGYGSEKKAQLSITVAPKRN